MIFYSRENGRDGEKDYIDTNDFADVYFEKEPFEYIIEGTTQNASIDFSLCFNVDTLAVSVSAETTVRSVRYSNSVDIDPVALVEQGATAYYDEKLLDDTDVIKTAKNSLMSFIKNEIVKAGYLLKGTNLDVIGTIVNQGNVIAVLDNFTLVDGETINVARYYSIVNIDTIKAGTLKIEISNENLLAGEIDSITRKNSDELTIKLSSSGYKIEDNTEPTEYKKSLEYKSVEEYYEDRAKFINIEEQSAESDFDEYDDLF